MNASERRAAYLDDLGGLLRPLTALRRIEVIDGVRDRIDTAVTALGREPSGEDMRVILDEIGTVEDVAAAALSNDEPAAAEPEPTPAPEPERPLPVRNFDLSSIPAMEWPEDQVPRPSWTRRWIPFVAALLLGVGAFFLMFILPAIVVIIGAILLWVSPLWTRAEKLVGTLVPTIGLGAFLPLLALGAGAEGNPTLVMIGFVSAILGVAALVWIVMRGVRAAVEVDAEFPPVAKKKR